jgi:HK97 family phage major capsid protein
MDPKELDTLERVDGKLEKVLAGQATLEEWKTKQDALREGLLSKITETSDKVTAQDKALERIESDLKKRRFDTGRTASGIVESDALLNALPDDMKAWIPRVKALRGGEFIGLDVGQPAERSHGSAALAQKDPIAYVGIASWLRSRIKAALAQRGGRPDQAQKWTEQGDKIGEALGGHMAEQKAALQEDTDAEGGYLVPTILEAVIGWIMKDSSVVRRAGPTVVQMTTKTHQLPSLANDFAVSWTSEEGVITDAAPAVPFSQGNLTAKKQTGLVTPSIELIQDSPINLMDFILTHLMSIVGRAEDLQVLEGDGTVFSGLFSVAGTNSVAHGGGNITWPSYMKAAYAGEHASTIDGGVYFQHPWVTRDLITTGIVNAGTDGFAMPSQIMVTISPTGSMQPTNIGGKPVFQSSVISRVRNTDETTVYHGNPAYIVIGDRMGTTFEANPWSETEWKKGQISLRLMRRVGILIWVPGYFTKLTAVQVAA